MRFRTIIVRGQFGIGFGRDGLARAVTGPGRRHGFEACRHAETVARQRVLQSPVRAYAIADSAPASSLPTATTCLRRWWTPAATRATWAAKYQAYFITKVPLWFGSDNLPAGVYGVGFVADKFVITDVGAMTSFQQQPRRMML